MKHGIALLLFLVGCSGATVNQGDVSLVTGDSDYDSTDKLRFNIEQTSHPMMFAGDKNRQDVSFRISIRNKSNAPVTIKRISLQSMGGSTYRLETQTRKFNKTIAPETEENFKYWASAIATDTVVATRAPLVVRATVDGVEGDTSIRAVFNRRVNDEFAIGVTSGH